MQRKNLQRNIHEKMRQGEGHEMREHIMYLLFGLYRRRCLLYPTCQYFLDGRPRRLKGYYLARNDCL